jgi:hypothetical protein
MVSPKDGFTRNSLVDTMSWDIMRCIDLKFMSDNYKDVIMSQKIYMNKKIHTNCVTYKLSNYIYTTMLLNIFN